MKHLVLLFILFSLKANAQEFFQRTFGGPGSEFGRGVVQTNDGGYACVGSTNSYSDGSSNVYLIKVDELGNYVWGRNIGELGSIEWGMDIVEDSDGNLIIAGYTNNTEGSHYDGLLIKVSGTGEIVWQRTFGSDDWDFFESLDIDSENSVYIAGNTYRDNSQKGWILKVDENGNEIWEETFTGSGNIFLTGIANCDDEKIGFSGFSENTLSEAKAFLSGVVNSNGNLTWVSTQNDWGDIRTSGCQCQNEIIFSIGTIYTGEERSFYFVKQGIEFGNVIQNNTIESTLNFFGESIDIASDGSIVIAGAGEFIFFEGLDAYIVKRDTNGGYISNDFNDTFGQPGYESFFGVFATEDGGYSAVGTTNSFGNGEQLYLVKIAQNGDVDPTNEDFLDLATPTWQEVSEDQPLLYPNPTHGFLNIESISPIISYSLSTLDGSVVIEEKGLQKNPEKLDLSGLEGGMYFLKLLYSDRSTSTHKVIKY